jgi:hypothetical protein
MKRKKKPIDTIWKIRKVWKNKFSCFSCNFQSAQNIPLESVLDLVRRKIHSRDFGFVQIRGNGVHSSFVDFSFSSSHSFRLFWIIQNRTWKFNSVTREFLMHYNVCVSFPYDYPFRNIVLCCAMLFVCYAINNFLYWG